MTVLPLLLGFLAAVPDGSPDRQPQLAASENAVAMVYGRDKSILFTQSNDGGQTFSKALEIAKLPVLALGRHRGPRVAFAGNTILVSAIGGTSVATGPHAHGLPADGDLLLWRSLDRGRTWKQAGTINDAPGSAREGLHAMAADSGGHVAAVWLDLRGKGTRLYAAFSNDAGATWSNNSLVYESPDGTICQCCHPSLAPLGNGEFAVMFRNALGGCRDMYLFTMRNGVASKPSKLGNGSWELNACPMDGGGIAVSNGRLVAAWRRADEVYLARAGEPETKIGAGKDVAIAASGARIFAVWTQGGTIQAWGRDQALQLTKSGAFANVVALKKGGALAAWEENGEIKTRKLE